MKPEKKAGKKRETKKAVKCPFFRPFYVGVCAGHKLPYIPSSEEKKQYCFNPDFRLCSIFENNSLLHGPGKE